jgi:hypothetical protein
MFASLCGQTAMPNVVIATTMWGEVREANGIRREEELTRDFWKDMVADGCRIERFKDTRESAWDIVGKNSGTTLLLQKEMGDNGKSLEETEAYKTLWRSLQWIVDLWKVFRKSLIG